MRINYFELGSGMCWIFLISSTIIIAITKAILLIIFWLYFCGCIIENFEENIKENKRNIKIGKIIKNKKKLCECDCHIQIGGSGKPCPKCIKEKCWEKRNES